MSVMLWAGAGVLAVVIVVVAGILAGRRDPPSGPDLGSISPRWLTEHNATRDGTS
jgi:hypothetical protein